MALVYDFFMRVRGAAIPRLAYLDPSALAWRLVRDPSLWGSIINWNHKLSFREKSG